MNHGRHGWKHALLIGLIVLVAPTLAAGLEAAPFQATLSGKVVLDSSGEPVVGATVTLVELDRTVTTGEEGRFSFDGVPDGTYKVVATASDLGSEVVSATVAGPDPVEVTIRLALVEEVVVTATRTRRGLDDVPVRTELITRDLLDAVSARTLADGVEYTTGVRVENNCQNCNFSQIRLLGLEGPYTQILIDGQPVISALAQVYGIEQIPARMIERIEVLKGGGSALYGPGSVGGVVNVIPREPRRTAFFMEAGVGLTEDIPSPTLSLSGDWISADRSTFLTAFGQLDEVRPFDVNDDGFTEVARRKLEAAGVRMNRYLLEGDGKLTVDASRFYENRRGGNRLDLPPQLADIAEAIQTERFGLTGSWLHQVNPDFDYTVTLSMADTSRDSYYGAGRDPNAFGDTQNTLLVADSQFNRYIGDHVVSWGGQITSDDLVDRQPAYDRTIEETYRNVGAFIQEDWSFAPGWQLLAGVRADKHSQVDGVIASPRVAIMASPWTSVRIRASVATGFRAPQAFDEDLHLSTVGGEARLVFLDDGLVEERSVNAMAGVEWTPTLGPGQALLEANAFHTRLSDLFFNRENDDPTTPAREFLKVNFGGADVQGVELNAGWGIGDELVLQGGVVFQSSRFDDPEPDFGSRDFFRTPGTYGNLSATWSKPGLANLFLGMRYTGSMVIPHYAGFIPEDRLETTEDLWVWDVQVSRSLPLAGQEVEVVAGVDNLTNTYQANVDRGPLRDSDYVYGPRFPRSLRLGLRWGF